MDRLMEYWNALEENEFDGKKVAFVAAICVLAGIIIGMLISPRKTKIHNYNECSDDCDCDCSDDCGCDCGK